jgi:prepilin-type N-terminal cleavage/methylation domain-containing protein
MALTASKGGRPMKLNNQKGLTLLEIILSMAILGILAISFLTMFSSGFKSIIKAGNKSVAAYDAQQSMTNKIIQADDLDSDEYIEETITFDFNGGPTIDLDIRLLDVSEDYKGSSSNMKGFKIEP